MFPSLQRSHLGALLADAHAMPVHWYYDRNALDRDYPDLEGMVAPRNPHPDSILWRSRYQPKSKDADILHDQARFWGKRGVHYHQFLAAGENTVNFKLARALYDQVIEEGFYDADTWLATYVRLMRTPGWHRDTYVEEYHRGFFEQRAQGRPLRSCAVSDLHIGGLASVPALVAALSAKSTPDPEAVVQTVIEHVGLTHDHDAVRQSAAALSRMLIGLAGGRALEEVIEQEAKPWITLAKAKTWAAFPDRAVIGQHLTSACYLPESFTASLYLVIKYRDCFAAGIRANTLCGGDNCHRGAVVGSLLGVLNPLPKTWES